MSVRTQAPVLLVLSALVALGACDGSTVEPVVEDPLEVREVMLVGDDGATVFSHADHWHGAPVLFEGGTVSFDLRFTSVRPPADEHDPPPAEDWFTLADHPGHTVRVVVEDTTLARWTGDAVRGTLHGLRAGASRFSIVVLRGPTTVFEAPPLNFRVQARPGG